MAASKRFLGLGFTFAATDNGLEKKLKNVSEHLTTITDKLNGIADVSKKAQVGLDAFSSVSTVSDKSINTTKMKRGALKAAPSPAGDGDIADLLEERSKEKSLEPKILTKEGADIGCCEKLIKRLDYWMKQVLVAMKAMGTFSKNMGFRGQEAGEAAQKKTKTGALGDFLREGVVSEKSIKALKKMYAANEKKLGAEAAQHIQENLKKMHVELNENGDIASSSMKKLENANNKAVKRFEELNNQTKVYIQFVKGLNAYIGKLSSSIESFLETLGVNIRQMIPPQIGAALGVIGAALSPLVIGLRNLAESKSKRNLQDKESSAYDAMMSVNDELTGKSTAPDGIIQTLKNLFGVRKKDGGGSQDGIFDKIKKFLYSIPFLGPAFQLLGKAVSTLLSPFKFLWGIVSKFIPSLASLGGAFRFMWNLITKGLPGLARFFVLAGIAVSALWGFVEGVRNARDKWIKVFDNLVAVGGKIIGWFMNFLAPVGKMIDAGANWLYGKLAGLTDIIFDMIKKAFNITPDSTAALFIDMIRDITKGIFDFVSQFLSKMMKLDLMGAGKMLFGGIKDGFKLIGENAPDLINAGLEAVNDAIPDPTLKDQQQQIQEKTLAEEVPRVDLKTTKGFDTAELVDGNKTLSEKFDSLIQLQREQISILRAQVGKPVSVNMNIKTDGAAIVNQVKRNEERVLTGAGIGH